jgi:HPt (histidine-containing phosphotransfer) domain-containing protein
VTVPLDASSTVIDHAALNMLRDAGGPELLVELVDLYLEDSPSQLAAVSEAGRLGDLEALQRSAHRLKSASAQLGASELTALCTDLEAWCRAGAAREAVTAVPAVEAAHATAVAQLAALRDAALDGANPASHADPHALAS